MMSAISNFKFRLAVKKINEGKVVAYPTEAVYGLGCNPLDEEAVLKLLDIKKRSVDKGLILIASSLTQLEPYLQLNNQIVSKVQATWPGPVTWIIPVQAWVPRWLRGNHLSLAVRVTNHPVARQLCEENQGPLVSTSANVSSKLPATRSWVVCKKLDWQEVFVLSGKVGGLKQSTPIFDVLSHQKLR